MTPERIKLCRQVASLFALTTSSVKGEAQSAKDRVKEIVKAHNLTFEDVSPHCNGNALALKVMRSFWSISETVSPAPEPAPRAYSDPGAWPPGGTYSTRADEDMFAQRLREHMERMSRGWGSASYGWDYAAPEPDPVTVTIDGQTMNVEDIPDALLRSYIGIHKMRADETQRYAGRAHDAIEQGEYAQAIRLLERLQVTSLSKSDLQKLEAEQHRRMMTPRPGPSFRGGRLEW